MASSKDFVIKNGLQANGPIKFGAGTTSVAPAAFQAGALLAVPVAHSQEWDGTALYMTNVSGGRKTLAYTDGNITGSAASLHTARNIALAGDASGTASFNGTADSTIAVTLAMTVAAGTSTKVTYDAKGRVTSGGALLASDIPALDWSKIGSGKPTTLSGYGIVDAINVSARGIANGVATLDANGKLIASQLPAIAIVDTFVVSSQTAMLALSDAETGDIAVRTDANKTYILKAAPYSTLTNWQELLTPTDEVSSVNGMKGNVTISTITGNAGTATALQTARTIAVSGDVSGSASFNGTANATIAAVLPNVVTAGTYVKTTVDAKGRVTSGAALAASDIPALDWTKITSGKPTTLAGYGITDNVLYAGGDAMTGTLTLAIGTATVAPLKLQAGALLTTPLANAVEWNGSNLAVTNNSAARKFVAFMDSTITGNAANVTGIVALANGGTGASTAASARSNLGLSAVAATGKFTDLSATPTTLAGYGITDATPRDESRNFGVLMYNGADGTTATFLAWLAAQGFFNYNHATAKFSWSFASNTDITDSGLGTIETAGAVVETWCERGTSSSNGTYGTITIRLICPNSGGSSFHEFIYNDQGSTYAPGWREVWNSATLNNLNQLAGVVPLTQGGTGANNAASARSNLGAQANLGFTPLQQGGGTGQSSNKVMIGWSTASKLQLQVDSTNFGSTWPIDVQGVAANVSGVVSLVNGGTGAADAATARSNLGLVVLSGTDGNSISHDGKDMNLLTSTGFYRGSSMANAPEGGWFFVTVEGHDGSWTKQTATTYGSSNVANKTYTRVRAGSAWTAWALSYASNSGIMRIDRDSFPQLVLKDTNAGTDLGQWAIWVNEGGGTLALGRQTDAGAGANGLTIDRNGNVNAASSLNVPTPVSASNGTTVPTTAWVRTYVASVSGNATDVDGGSY